MPRADTFISSLYSPGASKAVVRSRVLRPSEAAAASSGLRADAADLYYSAWVSFLDALHGINKGFYTWATVKLYYSVFYAFRASLALDDVCAFHVGRSPYIVIVKAGGTPVSCIDTGTHKTVLKTFQRRNRNHVLVSQQIGLEDAVDWLIERREIANYGHSRFTEPDCAREFDYVAESGLRNALNAYLPDAQFLYVFQPAHAMLAYPLRSLQLIGDQLMAAIPTGLTKDEQQFLRARAKDNCGNLAMLLAEMKRLTLVS